MDDQADPIDEIVKAFGDNRPRVPEAIETVWYLLETYGAEDALKALAETFQGYEQQASDPYDDCYERGDNPEAAALWSLARDYCARAARFAAEAMQREREAREARRAGTTT